MIWHDANPESTSNPVVGVCQSIYTPFFLNIFICVFFCVLFNTACILKTRPTGRYEKFSAKNWSLQCILLFLWLPLLALKYATQVGGVGGVGRLHVLHPVALCWLKCDWHANIKRPKNNFCPQKNCAMKNENQWKYIFVLYF